MPTPASPAKTTGHSIQIEVVLQLHVHRHWLSTLNRRHKLDAMRGGNCPLSNFQDQIKEGSRAHVVGDSLFVKCCRCTIILSPAFAGLNNISCLPGAYAPGFMPTPASPAKTTDHSIQIEVILQLHVHRHWLSTLN